MRPSFSIVVPAHNEAENLEVLLPALAGALSALDHWEVIVVDNASSDDTSDVVQNFAIRNPNIRVVSESRPGYGYAVLRGLNESTGEVIGIIRADNQEKPEDLVRMYQAFHGHRWDFCKAIRRSRTGDGFRRILISHFFNTGFRLMFGLKVRDINATPKIFTRELMNRLALESKDWFIDAEIVIKTHRLGVSMGEMEIEYLPRLKGKSAVRFKHILQFLVNMLRWRFKGTW